MVPPTVAGAFYIHSRSRPCPTDMPTGHSDGVSSSVEIPSPLLVTLTTKISHQRGGENEMHVRKSHNEIYCFVQLIYAN